MSPAFGFWLLHNQFHDEHLERIQLFWEARQSTDYLAAGKYTNPEDVAWILRQGVSDKRWIDEQVIRAWNLFSEEVDQA